MSTPLSGSFRAVSVRLRGRFGAILLCCSLLAAPAAVAQRDTVTVVAGEQYRLRNDLHRQLLGREYRDLWTAPIRVPLLDLDTFAGGLTAISTGGLKQTQAVRLRAPDGREFNFRSVDKELTRALPDFAKETPIDWLRQDQTAAQLPVAPLVATRLLDAAGVLNPGPRLFVMPDHPRLGEFRQQFAGMLGTLEIHPDEVDGPTPNFAGADRVVGSERFLELLEESPADRVDARAFLRARLMDGLLNDYDRHVGQWRWAGYERAGVRWWAPVAEDRDYAFVDHEGALLDLGRTLGIRRIIEFEDPYPDLLALVDNSLALNRRLLSELPRSVWDSTAADLKSRLTDAVIDEAIATMPAPYVALSGETLRTTLRARRDQLPEMAAAFYRLHAQVVEAHATDEADRAEVVRQQDGSVEVLLSRRAAVGAAPYFRRTVFPDETREVRIFMYGADDLAELSGPEGPIVVRVVGGGGDDEHRDRSGGPTVLYDDRGRNDFQTGRRTRVSKRSIREPEDRDNLLPESIRDWGISRSLVPYADWRPHVEVVTGVEYRRTEYAFRYAPFRMQHFARALFSPLAFRFGAEAGTTMGRESSPSRLELFARVSNLEATLFHGFGNDTERQASSLARVWHDRALVRALWTRPLVGGVEAGFGPVLRHTRPRVESGSPASLPGTLGTDPRTEAGLHGSVRFDSRDDAVFPTSGARVDATAEAFPALLDLGAPYAQGEARAAAYLRSPVAIPAVLAFRAAASRAVGDFPFYEAAFLGGSRLLRGYGTQRLAGDLALSGGAEVRVPIAPLELVLRGQAGVLGFADAGRVYMDGASPGGWHTSAGGGAWFATPLGAVSVTYALGETQRLYLKLGMPF